VSRGHRYTVSSSALGALCPIVASGEGTRNVRAPPSFSAFGSTLVKCVGCRMTLKVA
jgi:hypothetical protein